MGLGHRLKKERETRSWSQVYVAGKIGITNTVLSNYERDYRDPNTGTLTRLADLFEVTTDYLLGRTNKPKVNDTSEQEELEDKRMKVDDLLFEVLTEQPIKQDEVFRRMFTTLLHQTKCSESKLAKKLKVYPSTIASWKSGSISPNIRQLKEIAEIFHVNPLVFIYKDYKEGSKENNPFIHEQNYTHLPFYEAIPAGKSLEMLDSVGNVEVPLGIANQYPEAFFLEMSGDSMNKVIPEKAYALINPCIEVSNGEIAAVIVNGFDATLKRFYKLPNSVVLEPDSYNPEHSSKIYELNKKDSVTIHIMGKMVWFMPPLQDNYL